MVKVEKRPAHGRTGKISNNHGQDMARGRLCTGLLKPATTAADSALLQSQNEESLEGLEMEILPYQFYAVSGARTRGTSSQGPSETPQSYGRAKNCSSVPKPSRSLRYKKMNTLFPGYMNSPAVRWKDGHVLSAFPTAAHRPMPGSFERPGRYAVRKSAACGHCMTVTIVRRLLKPPEYISLGGKCNTPCPQIPVP